MRCAVVNQCPSRKMNYVFKLIDEICQVTIYCLEYNMNILTRYIWMRCIQYRWPGFYVNEIYFFLRAHSWLNWVDEDDDEDEVGLKENPEDTRYIKKITSK